MAIDSPDLAVRQCCRCQEFKPSAEFRFQGGKRPRYRPDCRQCENGAQRERHQQARHTYACRAPEARQEERRRRAERGGKAYRTREEVTAAALSPEEKTEHARAASRVYADAHREECRAASRKYQAAARKKRLAEYRAAHPELHHYECKSQAEFDAFRIGLRPWILFKSEADQYAARYALDDEFRQQEVARSAIRRSQRPDWSLQWTLRCAFKAMEKGAFSVLRQQTISERLGYSLASLRQHIEGLMIDGMSWQQYLDAEVVIDHIKPICRFDMRDRVQFLECWALTNLQPLTARANEVKSRRDRYDD